MGELTSTNDNRIGDPRLDFYSVGSTLDIAREQTKRGVAHGTLITAAHQTAGRGRRGAKWLAQPGTSALMTFVLRPNIDASSAWRLPFLASLACIEYLREAGCVPAQVKWPNDLMANGAKVGGILVETVEHGGTVYLLGIGINVAQESFPGGDDFVKRPSSLRMIFEEMGARHWPNTEDVIQGVSRHLGRVWGKYLDSSSRLMEQWRTFQMVGHSQSGIALDSGKRVQGIYRDVRIEDGAGMIELENMAAQDLTAVMPSAA